MASAHRPIFRCRSRAYMWSDHHSCFISPRSVSADPDDRIGNELELRNQHILWCWATTDTTSSVVVRPMTWAEPTAKRASFTQRYAAQMGTDPDHNEPVFLALTRRASQVGCFSIRRKICISR